MVCPECKRETGHYARHAWPCPPVPVNLYLPVGYARRLEQLTAEYEALPPSRYIQPFRDPYELRALVAQALQGRTRG